MPFKKKKNNYNQIILSLSHLEKKEKDRNKIITIL